MIVVDVETTGINPHDHSLLSIGALDFDNPENEFYAECRPFEGAHIDKSALEINGFTEEKLNDPHARTEKELVELFVEWTKGVGDVTFVGENPSFDRDFIKMAMARYGMNFNFAYRTIDIHSIAYAHMLGNGRFIPSKNRHTDLNLPKILAYCGLPSELNTHDAHDDVLCEAEVVSRLIYGKGLLDDFNSYPVPEHLKR